MLFRMRRIGPNIPLIVFNKIMSVREYSVELTFYYFAGEDRGKNANITINIYELISGLILTSHSNYLSKLKCRRPS